MNVEGADVERRLGPLAAAAAPCGVQPRHGGWRAARCRLLRRRASPLAVQVLAIGSLVPARRARSPCASSSPSPRPREVADGRRLGRRNAPGASGGRSLSGCSFSRSRSPRGRRTTGSPSRSSTGTTRRRRPEPSRFGVFVAAMTVGTALRRSGARPLRARRRPPGDGDARPRRAAPRRPRRRGCRRAGRRGALGPRRVARLPGRDQRRGRRPGPGRRAGLRRDVDRLHGVPRRAAADRPARRDLRDPARAPRRRSARSSSASLAGRRRATAQPGRARAS